MGGIIPDDFAVAVLVAAVVLVVVVYFGLDLVALVDVAVGVLIAVCFGLDLVVGLICFDLASVDVLACLVSVVFSRLETKM